MNNLLAGQLRVVDRYPSPLDAKKEVKENSIERQSSSESLNHLSKHQVIDEIKERLVKILKEKQEEKAQMKLKQNEIRKNLGQVAHSSVVRQIMRARKKFDDISNEKDNTRKGFNLSNLSEQNFIESKLIKFHMIRELYGVRQKEKNLMELQSNKGREIVRAFLKEQQR